MRHTSDKPDRFGIPKAGDARAGATPSGSRNVFCFRRSMSNKSKSHHLRFDQTTTLLTSNFEIAIRYLCHCRYPENIKLKPCNPSVKRAVAALPPRRLTFRFRTSEAVELVTSVESTKFGESPAITIDSSGVLDLANVVSHTVVLLLTSDGMKIAVNDAKIGTSIALTRPRPR